MVRRVAWIANSAASRVEQRFPDNARRWRGFIGEYAGRSTGGNHPNLRVFGSELYGRRMGERAQERPDLLELWARGRVFSEWRAAGREGAAARGGYGDRGRESLVFN